MVVISTATSVIRVVLRVVIAEGILDRRARATRREPSAHWYVLVLPSTAITDVLAQVASFTDLSLLLSCVVNRATVCTQCTEVRHLGLVLQRRVTTMSNRTDCVVMSRACRPRSYESCRIAWIELRRTDRNAYAI